MTRKEVLKRIEEQEKKGEFDVHVDPIDFDNYYPVDENFHYIKKGFKEKFKNWFLYVTKVLPFTKYINKKVFKTIVVGRENLKGIKKAIITCNHVNKFDCLVAKGSLRHRLYITAAYFNNQKGKFGDYMRAGGMMPFSSDNHKAMKNFNDAIEKRLNQNSYVLFYPEQAMWYNYEKPRPFKNGAFHYAVKHDVPVIPTFITYIDREEKDEEGINLKTFVFHIGKPIYVDKNLNNKDNIEYLRNEAYKQCVSIYESFYKKKLVYDVEVK